MSLGKRKNVKPNPSVLEKEHRDSVNIEFPDSLNEVSSDEEEVDDVVSDGENDAGPIFDASDESAADSDESNNVTSEDEDADDHSDDDYESSGDEDELGGEESAGENSALEDGHSSDEDPKISKNDANPAEKDAGAIELNINDNKLLLANDNAQGDMKKKKKLRKKIGRENSIEVGQVAGSSKSFNKDEYENDSSDEEDIRNTVGNIPMNWYDDYPHLGYNWEGKQILKPEKSDQLDEFLKRMEDPDFWKSVNDPQTGQKVVLADSDMDLISRLKLGKIPDASFQEYAPWVEWFTSKVMDMPLRKFPEHKRSFLPSLIEKEKVSKLVHALKMGWIKPEAEKAKERKLKKGLKFYMLWKAEEQEYIRRIHNHIPAPKRALPGHAESYNPPPEYLFDKKELKEWNKFKDTPWKRKLHYLPQKYDSLRQVPAYDKFVQERFQRCLDLYLCPRGRKMRLTIEPDDLVPKLPSPADLQPFPTVQSIVYSGHTDMVRCITIDGKGQYLVSGSDDMTIKVWEVSTGRCLKTIACGGVVRSVSWCPSQALCLLLVAADKKVLLINPGFGDNLTVTKTDALLEDAPPQEITPERISAVLKWEQTTQDSDEYQRGIRIILNHFKEVTQVAWHGRGDYFATTMPDAQHRSVLIHQLSRRRSQMPFSKSKGLVQRVIFHPIRPFLFVAFQRNVRIYDLVKQEIFKKLTSPARWISSMAVHPGGDNVILGTYDRKLLWYDLDLSTTPYQTLRLHNGAVRGVAFHPRYPLFASASDDRSVIVSHGMVYSDLLQNPLLVPLKRLQYHEQVNDVGVCDVLFHPTQPWTFSCGADHTVRLYT